MAKTPKSDTPCYTKKSKSGGTYTTCEGAQKRRKRKKVGKNETPEQNEQKAFLKLQSKKISQGFQGNYTGRINTGPLNPGLVSSVSFPVEPASSVGSMAKPQYDIDADLFLQVSQVMTQVGKENLKQGFDLPFPNNNTIGYINNQYIGPKYSQKIDPMVILREKPLSPSEFKKFLSGDEGGVSREDSALMKKYLETEGQKYKFGGKAQPYLAILGKIEGNRVRPHIYTQTMYSGDDGVGNKSSKFVNERTHDYVKIIFMSPKMKKTIASKTQVSGEDKGLTEGFKTTFSDYESVVQTQRRVGTQRLTSYQSYASIFNVKNRFLKEGDIGFTLTLDS